jgi:uncharacterized delta-60 repeat protein
MVITDFAGGSADVASSVALQFDGKIVVGGTSEGDFAVARYNADGTLDTSFGDGGKVTTDLGGADRINALVLQPDGAIAVAGEGNAQFALARYQAFLPPSLELTPDKSALTPGQSLRLDLTVANPGPPRHVDVYFGLLPPASAGPLFGCQDGDAVVFYERGFVPGPTCLSTALLAAPPALLAGVTLPGGLESTLLPDVYSVVWPSGLPPGLYRFFLALVRADTLEPIIVDTADVTVGP